MVPLNFLRSQTIKHVRHLSYFSSPNRSPHTPNTTSLSPPPLKSCPSLAHSNIFLPISHFSSPVAKQHHLPSLDLDHGKGNTTERFIHPLEQKRRPANDFLGPEYGKCCISASFWTSRAADVCGDSGDQIRSSMMHLRFELHGGRESGLQHCMDLKCPRVDYTWQSCRKRIHYTILDSFGSSGRNICFLLQRRLIPRRTVNDEYINIFFSVLHF